MAKGQVSNERIHRTDPQTGVEVLQLTSFPTPSVALSYQRQNFTPDCKTLLLRSQRMPVRDAPWDLYRVDADGSNLVQLTDSESVGTAALSPDGKFAYLTRGPALVRVEMDSCAEEEVCRVEGLQFRPGSDLAITPDGRYLFSPQTAEDGTAVMVRFKPDGSETVVMCRGLACGMLAYSPGNSGLLVAGDYQGKNTLMLVSDDGTVEGFTPNVYAHSGWLGRTGRAQGCALWPRRALLTAAKGDAEPKVIAEGPYFWHSAATLDGEWVIADTNWPDEGLQLVHVASGRFKTLCCPGASQGHPQWTHPHPGWSPDGSVVVFGSDGTGVSQVYLAKVSHDIKQELSSGRPL